MITVNKALELIKKSSKKRDDFEIIEINKALNKVIAEDIIAPISLPPFKQSIMDGYAICLHDNLEYKIVGEIKTGDHANLELKPGEAVRIFTGATVPKTANVVVMQENVLKQNLTIILNDIPKLGLNIRNQGEQIKKGEVSLKKGEQLNPSSLGLLKSFGQETVKVEVIPKITVITTGNELIPAGTQLQPGQIYESNSQVIQSALAQKGITVTANFKVKDSLEETTQVLSNSIEKSDIVLISGGISVGDYDFVSDALNNLGVDQIFYKVLQKPGKPLYFGKKDKTYVFALPGNPASTLTCLYVYVFPLIDKILGRNKIGLKQITLPISTDFNNSFGKALFLKAKIENSEVIILNQQNSAMILSFAHADALVYIPSISKAIKKGDLVTVYLLPQIV